jgi:uncharacterized phage protein (TIGR01671 family)
MNATAKTEATKRVVRKLIKPNRLMREIKFRAFYDGAIYKVTEIMWSNETACLFGQNDTDWESVELSKLELMQYTGLRDKNGKEIYEGDIVVCHPALAEDIQRENGRRYTVVYQAPIGSLNYQKVACGLS